MGKRTLVFVYVLMTALRCHADTNLPPEALALLQDASGWEYTAVFDKSNGFAEQHACFVEGHPNSDVCHGTMTLTPAGDFTAKVYVHGGSAERHGHYELDQDQIVFFDELGTKDGPYTLVVKVDAKTMRISMAEAGVTVGAEFLLEKEYKKKLQKP